MQLPRIRRHSLISRTLPAKPVWPAGDTHYVLPRAIPFVGLALNACRES